MSCPIYGATASLHSWARVLSLHVPCQHVAAADYPSPQTTQGPPTPRHSPALMPALEMELRHWPRGIAKHRIYVQMPPFCQRRASQMLHRCSAPGKKTPLACTREVPNPQLQNGGSVGYSRLLRPPPRCAGPSGPARCLAGRALGRGGPVLHWQQTPEREQILQDPRFSLAAYVLGSRCCTCGAAGYCCTCWTCAVRGAGRARKRPPSCAGTSGPPSGATSPAPPSMRGLRPGRVQRAAATSCASPRNAGGATSPATCEPRPCEPWKHAVIVVAATPGLTLLYTWTAGTELPPGWLRAVAASGWRAEQSKVDHSSAVR